MKDSEISGVFRLKPGLSLTLASASPRRRDLLSSLGLEFSICSPKMREPAPQSGEAPEKYAQKLAALKCRAAMSSVYAGPNIVLAGDTIVVVECEILGKPANKREALTMLRKLNGRRHRVVSAIHLAGLGFSEPFEKSLLDSAFVHFGSWTETALAAYAACGEPLDKAGSYAIQGKGAFLIDRLEGSWSTVVGLPLTLLVEELLQRGLIIPNIENMREV